jgi:ribonuclease T1
VAVAAVVGIGLPALQEDSASSPSSENEAIAVVLQAIEDGDPLPYEEDGQVFQNREGLLPPQPIGYYAEYTVETPGSPDRGARRLVIGDGGETYYTDDHYASFTLIDPSDYGQ